jgi:periplasmic protein TonB
MDGGDLRLQRSNSGCADFDSADLSRGTAADGDDVSDGSAARAGGGTEAGAGGTCYTVRTQMPGGQIFAPRVIPHDSYIAAKPEALPNINVAAIDQDGNGSGGELNPFGDDSQRPVVRARVTGPVRVSGLVVEGLLIRKTMPVYPPIAKASGTQGTVVLQATIAGDGSIENLRVVSGPAILQRAAMDAVKEWRYRPYLLSGEPVEVETTVNVVFKLQD